ncbi:MAG: asparagine--tRNA ligase, partial [Candidatus Bathyarchaeota archaeon]
MSFTPIEDVLDGCCEGKQVRVKGWIYRKRKSKDIIFLIIRDATGIVQCTVKKDKAAWTDAEKVTIESSVTLIGTVSRDERAPGGF